MKFFGFLILTALLVVFVGPFVPYWILMVGIFFLALVLKPGNLVAFFGGGFGFALSWVGLSLYLTIDTGSDLGGKMAAILSVQSSTVLLIVTGIVGFLLGAFSSLSGSMLRKLFKKKPDNIYGGW